MARGAAAHPELSGTGLQRRPVLSVVGSRALEDGVSGYHLRHAGCAAADVCADSAFRHGRRRACEARLRRCGTDSPYPGKPDSEVTTRFRTVMHLFVEPLVKKLVQT